MSDQDIHRLLETASVVCEEHEVELGKLDAAAGDGDHGAGMVRGMRSALAAVPDGGDLGCGGALVAAGEAFANAAGGASGALWGVLLSETGRTISATPTPTATSVVVALKQGLAALCVIGRSAPGDKTMIDSLDPFVAALAENVSRGTGLREAWTLAAESATQGAEATADWQTRRGRAAALGERSIGTVDPGARSLSLILTAVASLVPDLDPGGGSD